MTIRHSLLAIGTILTLALPTLAGPPHDMPVEGKIEHLETAARHLAEAGMMEESTRLRVQAAAMRRDLRHGELGELQTRIERLQAENHILQRRIEQLEAEAHVRNAERTTQPTPDLEQLAAEAHRQQTEATWAAIKRAARGTRPLPPATEPADQEQDLTPPAPLPPAMLDAEPDPILPPLGDTALLREILQALQRIEQKIAR